MPADANLPLGYHGRALLIDARTGCGTDIPLPPKVLRSFLGGSGLGTWLLLTLRGAELEPLSPAAPLVFAFSPLVGSPLTTSAKFAVCCKSPLTNRINDSLASSTFALAGKKTGYDALIITGRAAELSVLVIDDGHVRVEPASDLAQQTIPRTETLLRTRFGTDYSYAVIGPAGENGVSYATISHDGRHAGRGGSGAVLGAKNIKAIAVRGTQRTPWAFPSELVAAAKNLSDRSFGPATAKYRELGTVANLLVFNRLKALPTRNFQQGSFESAAELAPETWSPVKDRTRASCASCTIGCEHIFPLHHDGEASTPVRMEYENIFALGPLCGIRDPQAVLAASRQCDEWGLDTISTGGTIAFAMECVERGLLPEPWLRFSDAVALLRAIDLIAQRQELGQLLSLGSRRVAETIGQGSIDFAPQVKGLEIPGYEPRALQTMALGLAVGTRGADHNRSGAYEADFSTAVDRRQLVPENAFHAIATEDKAAIMDSLILCKFLRGVFADFYAESAELLRLVTGWDVTATELQTTARRIVAAKKLFNERAGWTPAEDTLPPRFLEQPLADDPAAVLSRETLQQAITAYYEGRGWQSDGWLSAALLQDLDLAEFEWQDTFLPDSATLE